LHQPVDECLPLQTFPSFYFDKHGIKMYQKEEEWLEASTAWNQYLTPELFRNQKIFELEVSTIKSSN